MELLEWFDMQRQLDHYIESQHGLENKSLLKQRTLALLVELSELANETRCFKFWSKKPPASKAIILEEFVDGVHFILSLGLALGYDKKILSIQTEEEKKADLTYLFLETYACIQRFSESMSFDDYETLFQQYFLLGRSLGFSLEEVQKAYKEKNEVNYERQQTGY